MECNGKIPAGLKDKLIHSCCCENQKNGQFFLSDLIYKVSGEVQTTNMEKLKNLRACDE